MHEYVCLFFFVLLRELSSVVQDMKKKGRLTLSFLFL